MHRLADIKQFQYIWKETIKAINKTVINPEDVLVNVDKVMYCKRNHTISSHTKYYCKLCSKQHYPENQLNDFEGVDVVREQCILNNRQRDFVFKNANDVELSGNLALHQIIKRASDRKIKKVKMFDKKPVTDDDARQFLTIDHFMEREGNNVAFLSSYINNVAIRWNTSVLPSLYEQSKNIDDTVAPPTGYKEVDGKMLCNSEDEIIA